jgi:broad specificity phosphatase PhoE
VRRTSKDVRQQLLLNCSITMTITTHRPLIIFNLFFFCTFLINDSTSHAATFQSLQHLMKKMNSDKYRTNNSNNKRSTKTFAFSDKAGVVYTEESDDPSSGKRLILIRHGSSTANEFMYRPGNRWGDATFTDDISFVDAPLSQKGLMQAKKLQEKFAQEYFKNNDNELNIQNIQVDDNLLVVTSPLTRCIQTMMIGVLPNLISLNADLGTEAKKAPTRPKVIVQPLATERVYTASDTGRPVTELKKEYPQLDFDTCFDDNNFNPESWWYTNHNYDNDDNNDYQEWRPNDKEQFYAVPGEPLDRFNNRMIRLFDWIKSRKEQTIILVCHWAVVRWLTGEDVENCDVKELQFDRLMLKDENMMKSCY